MSVAGEPGHRATELLEEPLIRGALALPVFATIALVLLAGELRDLRLFVLLAAAGGAVAFGAIIQPPLPPLPGRWDRDTVWAVVAGVVGPALAATLLLWAVSIDLRWFAPLFAMILLVNGFVAPWRLRPWMMLWIVVLWFGLILGGGERQPAILLLHLGGGLALLTTTIRTADALTIGSAQAAAARVAAERRAELLASLLRTQDLDPAVVLRSATDGLLTLGFDAAAIREIDHSAGLARLVDGVARGDVELPAALPLADEDIAAVLTTGRPWTLSGEGRPHAPLAGGSVRAAALYPILDGEEVVAIVAAGTAERTLSADAEEAAELLVAQAGEALLRARAYRADRETTRQLRRVEQRTQEFLSTVSHELRTPLTVVQGLTATLAGRWDELAPDRRQDLLRRIDANAERLASMVDRLLDTSQVTSSELLVTVQEVRLVPLLEAAIDRLDAVLAAHMVKVEVDEQLRVRVDPVLFDHVIDNLLVNVATHTPAGTVAVLSARGFDGRVEVQVVDDGPGIDDEDLPHLLERFYRGGDRSHRVSTRGLGLGLALAAEVVRGHGGTLEVGTGPGGGARFSFDVAAAPPR